MNEFARAQRKRARLRLGVTGPAGSGKTYSALLIAQGLGGKIAVIDTEHSSAELYSDLCEYDVAILDPPFEPKRYMTLLTAAEKANYATVIIDSLSHAWAGSGGLLDEQGKIADSDPRKNSFAAWRTVTPKHNALVEALLHSPCHIIGTMRSKQDYILVDDGKGRQRPQKVGMAPIQREGMDYEFTVVFDMSQEHTVTVSKDRTSLFDGRAPFVPTADTGKELLGWLNTGKEPPLVIPPAQSKFDRALAQLEYLTGGEDVASWQAALHRAAKDQTLTPDEVLELEAEFENHKSRWVVNE